MRKVIAQRILFWADSGYEDCHCPDMFFSMYETSIGTSFGITASEVLDHSNQFLSSFLHILQLINTFRAFNERIQILHHQAKPNKYGLKHILFIILNNNNKIKQKKQVPKSCQTIPLFKFPFKCSCTSLAMKRCTAKTASGSKISLEERFSLRNPPKRGKKPRKNEEKPNRKTKKLGPPKTERCQRWEISSFSRWLIFVRTATWRRRRLVAFLGRQVMNMFFPSNAIELQEPIL